MKIAALLLFALALSLPIGRLFLVQPGTIACNRGFEPKRAGIAALAQLPPAAIANSHRPGEAALDSVLAVLAAEAEPGRRARLVEQTAASIATEDLQHWIEALLASTEPAAAQLRQDLIRRWAESNPETAAAWLAGLRRGPVYHELLPQVAIALANSNPKAAAAWVAGLTPDDEQTTAAVAVAYETARTDPQLALTLAGTLPPGRDRDDALVHAISQWSASDFAAASAWALSLSDSPLRERLVSTAAVACPDPATGARLIATALSPGAEQNRAAIEIAQRWAQSSPESAAAWIAQFPPSSTRSAAERAFSELLKATTPPE